MKTTRRTTRKETTSSESTMIETVESECTGALDLQGEALMPDDDAWTYAETFEIVYPPTAGNGQSAQAKLFANDRQQIEVEVIISPRKANGDFASTSVGELQARLTFVRYEDGTPIPSTWKVDRDPNEYTRSYWAVPDERGEFSDGDRSPQKFPKTGGRVQDQYRVPMYIRASDVGTVWIAASIKPSGASQEIQTRPGAVGGFDSSITVNARAEPFVNVGVGPGSDGFSLSVTTRQGSQAYTRYNDWLMSLQLRGTKVRLKHLIQDPLHVPTIWWHSAHGETWGPWYFSFVLLAQPESYVPIEGGLPGKLRAYSGGKQFDTGHWYPSPVIGSHDGSVGFLFVSSTENYRFHYSNGFMAYENLMTRFHVIDEFGNEYGILVEIADAWDELRIKAADFRDSAATLQLLALQSSPSQRIARTPRRRLPRGATPWTRLSAFRVEPIKSESPGQIRTRVRVTLLAWNADGIQVTIPDDELETILTLVDHETGEPLSSKWKITHATEPVAPFDEQQRAGGRAVQTFDFWVESLVSCPAPIQVAASINPPDGTAPIQTRPGYSDGDTEFDDCVDVNTRRDRLWTLTTLDLTRESTSDKVFGNGLQQIRFKVELAFTDQLTGESGEPDDALDTIGIALFDESTPLPVSAVSTGWFTTPGVASSTDFTHFHGYDSYPEFVAVDPVDVGLREEPRANTSSFRYFYVACSGDQATRVKLCAYVKCRDGWLYTGNGKAFDECGREEEGYPGRSEEVSSIAPEDATIGQFPWEFDTLPGGNGSEDQPPTNPDTVRRYTLSYTDRRGNAAGIRYLQIAPEFPLPPDPPEGKFRSAMIQWHDQVSGEHRACFTGYAPPGSTTLVWDESLPNGTPTPLPTLPSANRKAAVVLLVGRQNIPFHSGMQKGPLTLTTTDWYGTTATLRLNFESGKGDGRWKLVLSK